MGASGWMFLLVLAHPGNPRQRAIIWLRVCSLTVILLIWPATSLKIVHLALWTKRLDTPDIHHLTTMELLPVNSESMKNVKCQQLTSALIMSSMDSNLLHYQYHSHGQVTQALLASPKNFTLLHYRYHSHHQETAALLIWLLNFNLLHYQYHTLCQPRQYIMM